MVPEGTDNNKLGFLIPEVLKIEEKIRDFHAFNASLQNVETSSADMRLRLTEAGTLTDDYKQELSTYASDIRTILADLIKAHRDVHPPISKFGKFIDKNCAEDASTLTSYFIDRVHKDNPIYSLDDGSVRSIEDSLRLVIIEHLLRLGRDSLATNLVQDFGFTERDVDLDKFRALSNLISSIHHGDIEFARKWLFEHHGQLGSQADELQYTLVKLDFLAAVKQQSDDPGAILRYARQLVPFAQTYASDFEHLMGSLVFLGRSLESTPYEDLAFTPATPDSTTTTRGEMDGSMKGCEGSVPNSTDNDVSALHKRPQSSDALAEAAKLFRASYCHQLNLSDVDPLCTVFGSGCRLLSRQQHLQRAISCLTKYNNADGDTLPIAVELDPVAHRHNIFHCPVIKEVVSTSNGPVRLSCGHAISRDAFESLPNTDRRSYGLGQSSSKVKCPYCPVETYKNQAMDLIF